MDTILLKCDTLIASVGENIGVCVASEGYGHTNSADVMIVGVICATVIILALFMLIAFWSKLHEAGGPAGKGEDRTDGDLSGKPNDATSPARDEADHDKAYREKLERQFLAFCESRIGEGDSLKERFWDDYRKVMGMYVSVLKEKTAERETSDSIYCQKDEDS